MNKKRADRELDYQIGEIALATMLGEGLITREEYEAARRYLIVKPKPLIGILDQAEYKQQYDEYEDRYNETQRRISEMEAHREALTAKRGKLKGYLDMLRKQGLIKTFNETLWCGAIEQVRIKEDGTMRFIFKDEAVVEG